MGMNSSTSNAVSWGRWIEWRPKARVTEDFEKGQSTKPSKPGCVGFDGAAPHEFAKSDAEKLIAHPHAQLFLFLGRKVRTPMGSGTLVQVVAGRVTVLLDSERKLCSFFHPTEIVPVSWEP
jgi:hypothetical protein